MEALVKSAKSGTPTGGIERKSRIGKQSTFIQLSGSSAFTMHPSPDDTMQNIRGFGELAIAEATGEDWYSPAKNPIQGSLF
jgi:hypothetical protein